MGSAFQVRKLYTLPWPWVFRSEHCIHFQVTCPARLIFKEIIVGGSVRRSPPGKAGGLVGRQAPQLQNSKVGVVEKQPKFHKANKIDTAIWRYLFCIRIKDLVNWRTAPNFHCRFYLYKRGACPPRAPCCSRGCRLYPRDLFALSLWTTENMLYGP